MKNILKFILLFILTALYMLELFIIVPIFTLLNAITRKDLDKKCEWLVNWFYNYVERYGKW